MKSFFVRIVNWIKSDYWRLAFVCFMLLLLFLMPKLAFDAGMSGDEHFHLKQAENVVNFYKTFGSDTTALSDVNNTGSNLHEYGQLPDNISYLIANIFNIEDIISVRHFVNSIFGWLGILFASLLAYRISGSWIAALMTAAMFFLSPRYLGHSFNNLKDVPFASMMIMGIYYITCFFQTLPKPPKRVVVMLAVSIGLALAIRVGGLLLIAYFGLFAIIYFIAKWWSLRKQKKTTGKTAASSKNKELSTLFLRLLMYGAIVCIGGYIVGILLWPYALVSPIEHVKATFLAMSSFVASLRQLFEGTLQWSDILPWYYTPKYILITIPIAVIIGTLIYPFLGGWKKENRFSTLLLYFTFIFPVFWIVYTNANVYGGWRHAMFSYPPMVVAGGLGFYALVCYLKNKYAKIAAIALPFLLLIPQLVHVIRNHPYEYVYFNELIGGTKKAYGNYEMDYYFHSSREAVEWILENAERTGLETTNKIKVAAWHQETVRNYLRKDTANFQVVFSRWYERSNNDWDYAVFVVTGMMPEQLKSEHFPPKNTVHTIQVDGKPICLVLKREDKSDLLGFKYKSENKIDSAEMYLLKALEIEEYNEPTMMNLIEMYLQTGQLEKAKPYIDKAVAYIPKYETSNYFLAHYYLAKNEYDEALKVCKQIIGDNYKFRGAYHLACNIYLRKNDVRSAEKILVDMIDTDQLDDQGVNQLIQIYKAQGMNDAAAYKKLYRVIAKSLEKRGKKEEAKTYYDMAKKLF